MILDVTAPPMGSGLTACDNNGTATGVRAQAAADYLKTNGGGALYFPGGTYLLDRTAPGGSGIANNYSVKIDSPNITIQGDGAASIILVDSPSTTPFYFSFPNAPGTGNVAVRNLKFKGHTGLGLVPSALEPYAATGGSGVGASLAIFGTKANPARNITIQGCLFEDVNKASPVALGWLDNVLITGTSFVHFKDFTPITMVRAATVVSPVSGTGNVPLSTGTMPDIDTVPNASWQLGDRVLLRNQTSPQENGVYVIKRLTPNKLLVRAEDADTATRVESLLVCVMEGSINLGRVFRAATGPIMLETSPVPIKSPFPVRFIESTNAIISPLALQKVDGGGAVDGNYILLAAPTQSTPPKGVYQVTPGLVLQRLFGTSPDNDENALLALASNGVSNQGKSFLVHDSNAAIAFTEISLPGSPAVYTQVAAASTGPVTLSPAPGSIDGTALSSNGVRVLLRSQNSDSQNGVYVYQSGNLTRARDAYLEQDIANLRVVVPKYRTTAGTPMNGRRIFVGRISPGSFALDAATNPTLISFTQVGQYVMPVTAATTGPLASMSGIPSGGIDGTLLVAGDRVLVKDQGAGNLVSHGIYVVDTGSWLRAQDMASNQVFEEGLVVVGDVGPTSSLNRGKIFALTASAASPVTVGTSDLDFREQVPPGLPSIFSGEETLGSLRIEACHFNGDYWWSGPNRGCSGLVVCRQGQAFQAEGNTLSNFTTAALRPNAHQVVVGGNQFYTTKRPAAAVSLSPDLIYFTDCALQIHGNNCEGALLVDNSAVVSSVVFDMVITGNNVMFPVNNGVGGMRILRGRRLTIHSNLIYKPSGFGIKVGGDGSGASHLSVVGNTIAGLISQAGSSNSAMDLNEVSSTDRFCRQVIIANNTLSSTASGGFHLVARKPNTFDCQMNLFDNGHVDPNGAANLPQIDPSQSEYEGGFDRIFSEQTGVVFSSLIDLSTTEYGVGGFYGRQFWGTAPATDAAKYSQGDVVWNTLRADQKSPLGHFHVSQGKLTPVFGAGMGFTVSAVINTGTSHTAMPLLAGLSGQRYRVLEVYFLLPSIPSGLTPGSLIVRSVPTLAKPTVRMIASAKQTDLQGAPVGRFDDTKVVYPTTGLDPNKWRLGELHDDGQGIEVIGSSDATGLNASAGGADLGGTPAVDVLVYVIGVFENT